ncbi:MAG: cobalamin biosynthesis protein CobD [Candidatus Puniceispirillum sp.]|jgi:adenosylcobinamide-phosphate synthase|uniref:adenosylcobinamide-phosphate synthase CbiB n=1 Tax=Candidatus Puniceispirillum sp. TaxID=2026719 RepID=UPI001EC07F78|nr:cobalamin biosynthesis protein CobD [Candidatus Puniceispirillum sp.]MBT6416376.1 cobalamin biosynthesis protein CobD [Candidatus Puniceispirillum sp.]MBT6567106.1 cobalamin biosynthesis protein CobD [Candidatus Puniceispirillum sp.]
MPLLSDIELRALVLIAAILIDRVLGEPALLWRHFPHPVVVFGKLIGFLEQRLNQKNKKWTGKRRRIHGVLAITILMISSGITGYMASFGGLIADIIIVTVLLAGKSLHEHIDAVAHALRRDITSARKAVGMIVGRRTDKLDEHEIARAAIETGAENLSDGVFAPAIWYLAFGLPGILIYKMTNTADSMIGYKNARYYAFGYGAAKFDDLLNYVPARLTALFISLAGILTGKFRLSNVHRIAPDAHTHNSPNAGWPEAAMAYALGIWLAGSRYYGNRLVDAPRMNIEGCLVKTDDIKKSLWILTLSQILFLVVIALLLIWRHASI